MSSNKQTANPIIDSTLITRSLLQLLAPSHICESNQKKHNRYGYEYYVQHHSLLSVDVVTEFKVEIVISISRVGVTDRVSSDACQPRIQLVRGSCG